MKIKVKAKPRAKTEEVEKIGERNFIVAVKEAPDKGKANEAISAVLAEYFDIPRSRVVLVSGHASRLKIFEIK